MLTAKAATLATAVAICVSACTTTPARPAAAHLPSTCGVHVSEIITPPPADRAEAIATLDLPPGSEVLDSVAVRAAIPYANKMGLPGTPRVLWLIYTKEPLPKGGHGLISVPAPAPVMPGTTPTPTQANDHWMHLIDDATMQPAGFRACNP